MKARFLWAGAASLALAAAIACGGSPTQSSQGNVRVAIKDSPFSDARAVLVTFSEVSIHASGGGWTTLVFTGGATSRTCDLKQLTSGAQDILGTGSLPAGHYTQVRLTVTSAVIYFDQAAGTGPCAATIAAPGGRNAAVDIPPGQIVLNREFDISNGNTGTILLDFDGDKSITQTGNGNYKMQPVISVVSVQ